MDIRHTRRLIAKRLDDAIETLTELRADIKGYEDSDRWLAEGLETVLENISQLASFADGGDFDELLADETTVERDLDDDEEESEEDDSDDVDEVDGELNFGDTSYNDDD